MNGSIEALESRLQTLAGDFPYPPTPDIAGKVVQRLSQESRREPRERHRTIRQRILAGSVLILILLIASLAVPSVRAAVIEFLQVGVIRIFFIEPTPTSTPTPLSGALSLLTPLPEQTPKSSPTPEDLISLAQIAGETTLETAISRADYELRLPSYPLDLGMPDRVFLQDANGTMVIFVWTAPGDPQKVRLILFQIPPGSWAGEKWAPSFVEETLVSGQAAVWAEGPYVLRLTNGEMDLIRLVAGHSLVWEESGITYRLESELSLQAAVKIAESLKPIP
jgi:hypothetical protein